MLPYGNLKKAFAKIGVASVAIAFALGLNYIYAWTDPSATPPLNNAAPPINTSLTNQIKDGGLGVGAFTDYGDALILGITDTQGGLILERRTSDPASPANGRIWLRTDL